MSIPHILRALHLLCFGSFLLVGCDRQNTVPDQPTAASTTLTAVSQVEFIDENVETGEGDDIDEYTDTDTDSGARAAATASRNVWFQYRKNMTGEMSNNVTIRVWDYTKKAGDFATILAAQGDPSSGSNYLYSDNFAKAYRDLKATRTYTTKKPGAAMYKRIKMKPGNYVVMLSDGAATTDVWHAFAVGDNDVKFSGAADDFTDSRDGLKNSVGRLKVSVWNGSMKPEKIGFTLLPDDGQTHDLTYWRAKAAEGEFAPVTLNTANATSTKKAAYYSFPTGSYVLIYGLSTDAIGNGEAMGFQKVAITSGAKYPAVKISFTAN